MTLSNVILFPQSMLPLHIFEPRYRRMLADALEGQRMFCVAMTRPGKSREMPSPVAGLGMIRAAVDNPDGTSNLILQGLVRVELGPAVRYRPYRVHKIAPLPTRTASSLASQALMSRLIDLVGDRLKLGFDLPFNPIPIPTQTAPAGGEEPVAVQAFRQVLNHLTKLDDPEQLADLVSATLLTNSMQRQIILETPDVESRLRFLIDFLVADIRHQSKKKS